MTPARELAFSVLRDLADGQETLDQVLTSHEGRMNRLNRSDRALSNELIYGVLRHQGQLDGIIHQHLRRSSKKIDPLIRIVLRLGVYQIRFLDRVPDSAAVDTAVEWTKKMNKKWAAGFVNGLLRSVARSDRPAPLPDPKSHPDGFLATAHSFPEWMVRRWLQRWGFDHTDAVCRSINTIPALTIRTNTIKVDRQTVLGSIRKESQQATPCRFSSEGIHVVSLKRPIGQWPAFRDGWFQVQSEAAQLVSLLLAPQPGDRVWDACAGLGTKAAHLAQLMENRGAILATDRQPAKLDRLHTEMDRLGIRIVQSEPMDLLCLDNHRVPGPFDRILLDAPCSGLGVLQRNPDGKWRTTMQDVRTNQSRQIEMINAVARRLKPGGVMVYAVCSMEPEENEQVIHGFLQKHPDFDIFLPSSARILERFGLLTPEGFLKTTPHPHQLDGFFAAALQRKSE